MRTNRWFQGLTYKTTYVSQQAIEDIIAKEVGLTPNKFYHQCILDIMTSDKWAYPNANLNDAFPHIKPMGVEEFVKKWWTVQ